MCGLSAEFLWRILLLNFVYFENNFVSCEELKNHVFNANIRDYEVKEDDINSTKVRTLQKEEVGRYASFAPIRNPIRFKEIPDNALSSSSYSRGLLHHDNGGHGHEGYGIHDGYYEDGSPYGHGYGYVHDHGPHDYDHHDHHGHGHHFGHHLGHHHKHHDHHHLATKALLWPIAGIALLGAAAALVTNPVLLQLGVISGKRRRRDTMEALDSTSDEWPLDPYTSVKKVQTTGQVAKSKKNRFIPIPLNTMEDSTSDEWPLDPYTRNGKEIANVKKLHQAAGHVSKSEKNRFIPIPLKLNKRH